MIDIVKYDEISNEDILDIEAIVTDVGDTVSQIIEDVKQNGDKALYAYAKKFDKVELSSLLVTKKEIAQAYEMVDEKFINILKQSYKNIKRFHEKQLREGFEIKEENGTVVGQKIVPIEKAGIYVPGGTAAYPSTVLMNGIPAKIAGCSEIVMVTPPDEEGNINSNVLVAADIVGVDKIYKIGGAQAIAALSFGTESIPKVDKIVGPGNAYVAEAKKQVFGRVSIDMIAGPSEILVIADKYTNANYIAADMLSQAEHDKMATAVLVTDDENLAINVQLEIERQLALLEREEIARASIESNGKIIIVNDISEAIDVANAIAPEHLELCIEEPFVALNKIKHAGSVFLGNSCPEVLGDYYAGSNHTLPTSGTARFSSPLSVDDFIKKTQYIYYTEEEFKDVASDVAYFASKEGLTAHSRSALVRLEE